MSARDFLNVLNERGLVYQKTDEVEEHFTMLDEHHKPLKAYCGFDLTANSLHVGSLLPLMMLYWLGETGGKPVGLVGTATTLAGDPTGKKKARDKADERVVMDRAKRIEGQIRSVVHDAEIVHNGYYWSSLNFMDFLRDVGHHTSVNRMMSAEFVTSRLDNEEHLPLSEFLYATMQAYDFVMLNNEAGVTLQMGGSDQWGNITAGTELARHHGSRLHAITCPLLTTSTGAKMGKTGDGAVWLDREMFPVFQFWQYWRNVSDEDVCRLLRMITTVPISEILRLEQLKGAEINDAKIALADAVTAFIHGDEAVRLLREKPDTVCPVFTITRNQIGQGYGLLNALCATNLSESNSRARQLVKGSGVRVNSQIAQDPTMLLSPELFEGEGVLLAVGKKKQARLRAV